MLHNRENVLNKNNFTVIDSDLIREQLLKNRPLMVFIIRTTKTSNQDLK